MTPSAPAGYWFRPQARSPKGRSQRAKPAGPGCAGAACGPPLPLQKPCLYIQYKPYNSIKFILFSTDLPPSAIRRASISCQKSASIGPSPCKRLFAHSSAGFVPGQGIGVQPPPAFLIHTVFYYQIIHLFDGIPHGFAITYAVYHFCRIKTPRNNSVKENQK